MKYFLDTNVIIDMLIAATVIANDGILVTHNVGEFSRIEGLVIEDWAKD